MKTKTTMVALATLLIGNHYFWLGRVVSSCLKVIMTRQRLSLLLVCAPVVLFMFACGDSAAPKDRKRGEIVSDDGLAWLSVPNGAVPSGVTLTIKDATATAPVIAMGNVYTIGPAGTQFSSPASLSIMLPFDPADIWTDITGQDLAITRLDGDRWTTLESTYDSDTRTLTAEITHLSTFGYNLASNHHTSIVEDGDPAMVWADQWRGIVAAGLLHIEGGDPSVQRQPGILRHTSAFLGNLEEPEAIAFLNRTFAKDELAVRWEPALVFAHFSEISIPSTLHQTNCCGRPTFSLQLSNPPLQQKDPDDLAELSIITELRSYFLNFSLRPGQSLDIEYFVSCIHPEPDNPHWGGVEGIRQQPIERIGDEIGEPLPSAGSILNSGRRRSGKDHTLILGNKTHQLTDGISWNLEPYYYPDLWKLKYASMLRDRREFMVRKSMWEEIAQKCARGEQRGISCRAATRMLRNYDATVNRWVNDCERIQAALLHQTVTPLLTGSSVYDYAVLQGPVDFCWFTHNALLSFIPIMPAGSTTWFHDRLPAELKVLYSVRDLDMLFAP